MQTIPVFYSPKMVAQNLTSESPSAGKPALVVESWKNLGLPLSFHDPKPVTLVEFYRAHHAGHVDDILDCRKKNGFSNKDPEVAAALPYTSGAMLSAARHLMKSQEMVAAAPCSGFHHAGYAEVEGFCTFNGLMVTALAIRAEYPEARIGILDFDQHYGNGTDDILSMFPEHRHWCTHFTAGADYRSAQQAPVFFSRLNSILDKFEGCEIVLYQAGADPHIDDPFGGWLTTEQLRVRDFEVFKGLKERGIRVVWNLAGGYQREPDGSIPKVLEIHDNTMRECAKVHL